MNNFFLLNEALNCGNIQDLERGVVRLNDVIINRDQANDTLMKHESLWSYNNGICTITELYYSIISEETRRLVPVVFESLRSYDTYVNNEIIFDAHFPDSCNAFLGIAFGGTAIPQDRQVVDRQTFDLLKNNCAQANAYNSIQDYWANRNVLFPNLIFCDHIINQITHLSIQDDRFKLMDAKLKRLNSFVGTWKAGTFDFKSLGLDCSPDTPTRVKNTEALRTFDCPGIGHRIFSLHVKWSFGREFFRLYFFPEEQNRRVYIGYIGDKNDIGFA